MNNLLHIKEDVKTALQEKKPVLALESTIISHGLPYPQNIQIARQLEKICREAEVVPATICLMNGKIKIGITEEELEKLATEKGVAKVSRRDFAAVLATGKTGATTVAGTMIAAYMAGIQVFSTGGIGGVHRQAEQTFDISADLIELAKTPVLVVSAGAKAILDLPKTLEYLETMGVPVYGYKTNLFPAFYSSRSALSIELIESEKQIAEALIVQKKIGFQQGMLIANPIPPEHEIPHEKMNRFIETALAEAKRLSIVGKAVTPFLLSKLVELTKGKSLQANLELVKNNVQLGAKIAIELEKKYNSRK
jgi:pseudouridylate synthase